MKLNNFIIIFLAYGWLITSTMLGGWMAIDGLYNSDLILFTIGNALMFCSGTAAMAVCSHVNGYKPKKRFRKSKPKFDWDDSVWKKLRLDPKKFGDPDKTHRSWLDDLVSTEDWEYNDINPWDDFPPGGCHSSHEMCGTNDGIPKYDIWRGHKPEKYHEKNEPFLQRLLDKGVTVDEINQADDFALDTMSEVMIGERLAVLSKKKPKKKKAKSKAKKSKTTKKKDIPLSSAQLSRYNQYFPKKRKKKGKK